MASDPQAAKARALGSMSGTPIGSDPPRGRPAVERAAGEATPRATTRNVTEADEPRVVQLLSRAFRRWPAFELPVPPLEHLRWKMRSDPIAPRHQWVTEVDGRIAASILRVIRRVRIKGRDCLARDDVDAAVDPDYQGQGLYRAILDHVFERRRDAEFDLTFWYSTNPKTRRRGRPDEDGELLGDPIQVLEKLYRARPIVARRRRRYGGRLPVSLAVLRIRLATALNRLGHPPYWRRARCAGSITTLKRFDDRIEALFDAAAEPFDFVVVRGEDYMNWRYCDPAAGVFTLRAAEQQGRLLGYLVFKIAEGEGYIADLLALPGRTDVVRSLIEDALHSFREAGVERAICWMTSRHPYHGILRRYGFVDSGREAGFRCRAVSLDKSELEFLGDERARVHLTLGDSDWI
jgi:GNAT superfamily N-acetyltransferase